MGWLFVIVLAGAVVLALWRFGRLGPAALQLVAAALLLGMAGYAWQGRPSLAGSPRRAAERPPAPETAFSALRRDMFGAFDNADRWLTIAEGFQRRGDTEDGAGVVRSAIRAHPGNATLWLGYGDALMLHSGGLLSPAADHAYRRSIALAPRHPGPRIFYGIAMAQNGRFEEAERLWRQALTLSPANAPWREGLEGQIAMLEQARATTQNRAAQAPAKARPR